MKIPHKKGQRNKHASPSRYAYYITEKGLLQMTNEELAVRIQRGETGLYAHLWAVQNETEVWQMKGGVSHA